MAEPSKEADKPGNNSMAGTRGRWVYNITLCLLYIVLGAFALCGRHAHSVFNTGTIPKPETELPEITFQQVKSKLLPQGNVQRLEVARKSIVRVFMKPKGNYIDHIYKYYFYIGNVAAFERKLEQAQLEMGRTPDTFIPVRYLTRFSLWKAVLELLPWLIIIAILGFVA